MDAANSASSFTTESAKIDALVAGSAAVSAPAHAKNGVPFNVYLRVSPEQLNLVLSGLKQDFPENETLAGKSGVKLTSRMTAGVSGFGFEISPSANQMQGVSATEVTTWEWQVKPLNSGVHALNFTLSGELNLQGKEVERNFYQYKQAIDVTVSPLGFAQQYWQWLATSIFIPVVGAGWAVFRKPKDAAGARQPSVAENLRVRRRQRNSA